jgi:hypothetical protein
MPNLYGVWPKQIGKNMLKKIISLIFLWSISIFAFADACNKSYFVTIQQTENSPIYVRVEALGYIDSSPKNLTLNKGEQNTISLKLNYNTFAGISTRAKIILAESKDLPATIHCIITITLHSNGLFCSSESKVESFSSSQCACKYEDFHYLCTH